MEKQADLKVGQVLSSDELVNMFRCSGQGGMRRSIRTNSLILISFHTIENVYEDRWAGKIFYYTGMGTKGDQSLAFAQNRTLWESNQNGVNIYLFEVFKKGEYTFMGRVRLADEPFIETQKDSDKIERKVYIFPLEIIGDLVPIEVRELLNIETEKLKYARELSDSELKERAKEASGEIGVRKVYTEHYSRNPYVSEYAKRRAHGKCQLCKLSAPFNDPQGKPFLEVHHIEWLSNGGADSIDNAVALCPNCHSKMHILNLDRDIKLLKEVIGEIV